jgi:hypothetical protein
LFGSRRAKPGSAREPVVHRYRQKLNGTSGPLVRLGGMNAVRVPWSDASFLAYFGGLTILVAVVALLSIESSEHASGAFVGLSAVIFAFVMLLALAARRGGRLVTAGLYGLTAVVSFVVLFGALLNWFGWLPHANGHLFQGFRFWLLVLELSAVVAAAVALRAFHFPLLVFVVATTAWFFVTDLLSNGGDWTAIVTILYGLVLLNVATRADGRGSRIYGFWLHVVAGLTIGGGLLWFFHKSDFDWIVIAFVALGYIALGNRLVRSSWVVLAAWGLFQVTTHFAEKWAEVQFLAFFPLGLFFLPFFGLSTSNATKQHPWAAPLAYGVLGLVLIVIAQLLVRRRRDAIAAAQI